MGCLIPLLAIVGVVMLASLVCTIPMVLICGTIFIKNKLIYICMK